MIFVIFVTIVVVFSLIGGLLDNWDRAGGAFNGLLVGIFFSLFLFIIVDVLVPKKTLTYERFEPIYSMNIIGETHGSFFLGTGSFNSQEQYAFFTKKGNAFIRSYAPNSSLIIETTNSPRYCWTEEVTFQPEWWLSWKITKLTNYRLEIPVGSVIQRFDIR